MASNKRFSAKQRKAAARFEANEPRIDSRDLPILFSLERMPNTRYCLSRLKADHRAAFAMSIFKRKNMTLKQVIQSDRHGLGSEKIAKTSIKTNTNLPSVTEDLTDFIALRYKDNHPMVGYIQKNVFYVLWFDYNFSLYNH